MKLSKKLLSAVALTAVFGLTLGACSQSPSSPEPAPNDENNSSEESNVKDILPEGKLRSAIHLGFPPLEYTDLQTDEIIGFDIDMLNAIGEKLGVEVELATMEWQQMMPSLETGRVDVLMSGTYDTKERQEKFDWIDYLLDGGQMFANAEYADKFKKIEDFCGEVIGSVRGERIADELVAWSEENCPADKQFELLLGQGAPDLFTYLQQDRVMGAATPSATLAYHMSQNPGKYITVGDQLSPNYFGIAVMKDQPELRDAIWDALEEIVEEGTYDELLKKYGLENSKVSPFTMNLEPRN